LFVFGFRHPEESQQDEPFNASRAASDERDRLAVGPCALRAGEYLPQISIADIGGCITRVDYDSNVVGLSCGSPDKGKDGQSQEKPSRYQFDAHARSCLKK
jgi:hypothetical protein